MARNPEHRYSTGQETCEALTQAIEAQNNFAASMTPPTGVMSPTQINQPFVHKESLVTQVSGRFVEGHVEGRAEDFVEDFIQEPVKKRKSKTKDDKKQKSEIKIKEKEEKLKKKKAKHQAMTLIAVN